MSHVKFADDILVFINDNLDSTRAIKNYIGKLPTPFWFED